MKISTVDDWESFPMRESMSKNIGLISKQLQKKKDALTMRVISAISRGDYETATQALRNADPKIRQLTVQSQRIFETMLDNYYEASVDELRGKGIFGNPFEAIEIAEGINRLLGEFPKINTTSIVLPDPMDREIADYVTETGKKQARFYTEVLPEEHEKTVPLILDGIRKQQGEVSFDIEFRVRSQKRSFRGVTSLDKDEVPYTRPKDVVQIHAYKDGASLGEINISVISVVPESMANFSGYHTGNIFAVNAKGFSSKMLKEI